MDSTISDELCQRHLRDITSNWIKATHHDDSRCLIDDHVNTSGFFKGFNVAPFTTNNSTFHFIIGDIN